MNEPVPDTNAPIAKPSLTVEWCLRVTCAAMLAGHGWMAWNGQMPLRALLWDEDLASGVVQTLAGMDWGTWVSSMEVDEGIGRAIRAQAYIFFGFAIAALVPVCRRAFGIFYLAAALNLSFLAWLKYHDSGSGVGEFFEHASQFCLPLVLALYAWGRRWQLLAKLSLAATFICHGLFALDLPSQISWLNHPRPGYFIEMPMLCLKIESEAAAGHLLRFAGIADFVVAVMIFFRGWPRLAGLFYMLVWGFVTALARPWAYYEPTAATETLMRWIPELLYRVPHFALPLCLILALQRRRAKN